MRSRSLYAVTVSVALAAGVGGCAAEEEREPLEPGLHQQLSFTTSNNERNYALYAPESYDPEVPIPLVLVLHGRPGTGLQMVGTTRLHEVAEEEGFLVAYPTGDVTASVARDLVEQVSSDWKVAAGAIYAAGFSAGGTASWRLAIDASDLFAAIASVGGPYSPGATPEVPPEPVPALALVGLADSQWLSRIDNGLEAWRAGLECATDEPQWLNDDETTSRHASRCRDGSEVVEYRIDGLAHRWPAEIAPGIGADETIWEFFAAHRRD